MRRILRKIAEDEFGNLGDTSTLADPAVVDDLISNRQNKRVAGGLIGRLRPKHGFAGAPTQLNRRTFLYGGCDGAEALVHGPPRMPSGKAISSIWASP